MKWNGKTIGGIALALLGFVTLFTWGGLPALICYAIAFALLFFGYRFWREADNLLKRICSAIGMLAGAVLLIYWLPQFISLVLSIALIGGGLWLIALGQAKFYSFRIK